MERLTNGQVRSTRGGARGGATGADEKGIEGLSKSKAAPIVQEQNPQVPTPPSGPEPHRNDAEMDQLCPNGWTASTNPPSIDDLDSYEWATGATCNDTGVHYPYHYNS